MIDLDKDRAARREAKGTGPQVLIGGTTYELAPELPYGALEAMEHMHGDDVSPEAIVRSARAMLGDAYEPFLASNPSVDDLNFLLEKLMEEYGLGNTSASAS